MDPAVIVLGSGVAGLAAARALSQGGIPVLMLEARRRIGGRIHTLHGESGSFPTELGAEFVHGKPPEIWAAVKARALRAVETEGDFWCFRHGRLERPDAIFRATGRLNGALDRAPEQSYAQFAASQPADDETRRWAAGYIEGFHAARTEEVSVRSLALTNRAEEAIDGGHAFRIDGGYQALVDWLRTGFKPQMVDLRLGAVVKTAEWRRGHVEVTALVSDKAERFHAPRLVSTIPLAVLAAGGVSFRPEPEPLRAALGSIATGHAARITFRFRRRIWEDRKELRGLGFLFSQELWMPTWWTHAPSQEPVLTGWTGGPRAEAPPENPGDWVAPSLSTLGKLLGQSPDVLRQELISWHAHNWTADPFARGAYTYIRVGGLEALRRFGEPIEETLYFAGEATNSEGYWAMVHGAIASGERAAKLVLGSEGG